MSASKTVILACNWCGGVGEVSDGYNGRRDCDICNGKGELERQQPLCPRCKGQGYQVDPYSVVYPMTLPCDKCDGLGTLRAKQ